MSDDRYGSAKTHISSENVQVLWSSISGRILKCRAAEYVQMPALRVMYIIYMLFTIVADAV